MILVISLILLLLFLFEHLFMPFDINCVLSEQNFVIVLLLLVKLSEHDIVRLLTNNILLYLNHLSSTIKLTFFIMDKRNLTSLLLIERITNANVSLERFN